MSKFTYVLTKEDEELQIKSLLRREFAFSSRLMIKLKTEGGTKLNDEPIRLYFQGKAGDRISVDLPEEHSEFPPEAIPLDIIYEDDDLLLINKQPGFVVHPTRGHPYHTMVNGIMQHMIDTEQSFKIRLVNRLDMNTSGLFVVAKNSHGQDYFMKRMKRNEVKKRYVAIVKGTMEQSEGVIDLPIGRVSPDDVRRAVVEDGYPSVTHYRVLATYEKDYSFIELSLETGRTHQIRVHMSSIGHPIVSDSLYGVEEPELISRQALHAKSLAFYHPVTEEYMEAEAPIPEDMLNLMKKLGREYRI